MPCEMCHKPVTEWDNYYVKLATKGIGIGHTLCWNCQTGQLKQLCKAIKEIKKQ